MPVKGSRRGPSLGSGNAKAFLGGRGDSNASHLSIHGCVLKVPALPVSSLGRS